MQVNTLMELAAQEAAAAERRTVAEAVWRSSWWKTTRALGGLPTAGVGKELERIAPVLGTSAGWLGKRRMLGGKVTLEDDELLEQVPPRLAIEYTKGERVLDAAGARFLITWEAEDKSLRDLATHLGTAGRSWQNREQLDEREAATQPSVEQIRAALADPEIAREVVAHGPTRANFQGATDSWAREETRETRWAPVPTNFAVTEAIAKVYGDVMRARELMHGVRTHLTDLALDGEQIDQLLARVADVGDEVTLIRDVLHGQVRFAEDMQRMGVHR